MSASMERSHLELPSPRMRSRECHEEHYNLQSPEKMSRPQKRRKRAARSAIRAALCNSFALKSTLGVPVQEDINQASPSEVHSVFSKSPCIESKLLSMEAKIDTLLSLCQPLWDASQFCYSEPGECNEAHAISDINNDKVSKVLQYLNPDAPEFLPQSPSSEEPQQAGQDDRSLERIEYLENRADEMESEVVELQDKVISNISEVATSLAHVEERIDLEVSRLRVQMDADYSRCARSIATLESRSEPCANASSSSHQPSETPSLARAAKIDLNADVSSFTPMQKGLFKQMGGMLNALVEDRRRKQLKELRDNLSGQKEGHLKDQQCQVLDFLECQLNK